MACRARRAAVALVGAGRARRSTFPPLTGRVVDAGRHPRRRTRRQRSSRSSPISRRSPAIQLVVATVARSQGTTIEHYANQLVPRLEARPRRQEQRRPAARRAERAQGAHRGRLRPRGHADRRAVRASSSPTRSRRGSRPATSAAAITRGVDDIITVADRPTPSEWQHARPADARQRTGRARLARSPVFFVFVRALRRLGGAIRRFAAAGAAAAASASGGGARCRLLGRRRLLRRRRRLRRRGRLFRRRRVVGRRRRVGELVMEMSPQDRDRITAAIRAVEARTTGEIVCVLARHVSDYRLVPFLWAGLASLVVPAAIVLSGLEPHRWPLVGESWTTGEVSDSGVAAAVAASLAAVVALQACLPRCGARAGAGIDPPRRSRRPRSGATGGTVIDQFLARGLQRTKARTGADLGRPGRASGRGGGGRRHLSPRRPLALGRRGRRPDRRGARAIRRSRR